MHPLDITKQKAHVQKVQREICMKVLEEDSLLAAYMLKGEAKLAEATKELAR